MNRRSFAKASIGAAGLLAAVGCNQQSGTASSPDANKVTAAMKRLESAVKNIAGDVDKLFEKQRTVLVPDFPADLTELRVAYDDLRSATGYLGGD